MALSPHPRKYILHVTHIDVETGDEFAKTDGKDQVEILFHGKVNPSTKQRLDKVIQADGDIAFKERKLA